MSSTEAEVASSISKQEGSLALALKSFNASHSVLPPSSTPEIAIPSDENKAQTNGHSKSIRFADDVVSDEQKGNLSKSADGISHSVTPPIHIGSACLSHSLDYTPKKASKIVGTPADFRRHITEEEFNKRNNIQQDTTSNTRTTERHSNKEFSSSNDTALPQTTQPKSSLTFSKVSLKKPEEKNHVNTIDSNVVYEVNSVEFKRTVGGFKKP